jgi:hypothetical protein
LTGFTRGKTALKIPKFLKSWIVSSPHHPTLGQDVFGLAIILLEVALHDMVKLDSKRHCKFRELAGVGGLLEF